MYACFTKYKTKYKTKQGSFLNLSRLTKVKTVLKTYGNKDRKEKITSRQLLQKVDNLI